MDVPAWETSEACERWRRLWRDGAAPGWDADAPRFQPFDRLATLTDRDGIERHCARRRDRARWVADRGDVVAHWSAGTARIWIAQVAVDLETDGGIERRDLTLTIVIRDGALAVVAEAVPAMLLDVLAGYREQGGA